MITTPGSRQAQVERGHPYLALAAALIAIAAVGITMFLGRSGQFSADIQAPAALSQPVTHTPFMQEVFYVVESSEAGEAMLAAEGNAANDAVLMGGEPPMRRVQVLVIASADDEWLLDNLAAEVESDRWVQIIDTRTQVPIFVQRLAPYEEQAPATEVLPDD